MAKFTYPHRPRVQVLDLGTGTYQDLDLPQGAMAVRLRGAGVTVDVSLGNDRLQVRVNPDDGYSHLAYQEVVAHTIQARLDLAGVPIGTEEPTP